METGRFVENCDVQEFLDDVALRMRWHDRPAWKHHQRVEMDQPSPNVPLCEDRRSSDSCATKASVTGRAISSGKNGFLHSDRTLGDDW
nr:hypothetical protein CFP56_24583 [Quercus suber]